MTPGSEPADCAPAARVYRLLLADDHTLFREGLAELLSLEPDFTVVAHTGSGYGAVDLSVELRPDLLLLDVAMPGPGPDAVIERVTSEVRETQVVVLTMYDDPLLTARLLARGAAAYTGKSAGRAELLRVLRTVGANGEGGADPVAAEDDRAARRGSELSAREGEVLELLAGGLSNARIASRLGIAEATVKRHLTQVYRKLGVSSRTDALRLAYSERLLGSGPTHPPPVPALVAIPAPVPGSGPAPAHIPESNAGQSRT